MNTKRNLTEADYEAIITNCLVFGKTQSAVANEIGLKPAIVGHVVRAFNYVKNANWDEAVRLIEQNQSLKMFEWAARRLDVKIPDHVYMAAEAAKDARKAARSGKPKEAPVEPEKPATEAKNETVYFCRLLEEIQRQNELLEQLIDVVIPKYVSDLKDNQNANFDAQTAEIKKGLDAIAANKRKRGL